jgi:Effector-associated domain 10
LYSAPDREDRQAKMFIPEELVDIIKRIASNTHTEDDLQRLGQMFGVTVPAGERSVAINRDANGATITTGDGNTILNITFQADGLRIGDKDYEGDGAELLRSLLQAMLRGGKGWDEVKASDKQNSVINQNSHNEFTNTTINIQNSRDISLWNNNIS